MNKKRKWWWLFSYRIKTATHVKIRVQKQNVQLNLKQCEFKLLLESTYTQVNASRHNSCIFQGPIGNIYHDCEEMKQWIIFGREIYFKNRMWYIFSDHISHNKINYLRLEIGRRLIKHPCLIAQTQITRKNYQWL